MHDHHHGELFRLSGVDGRKLYQRMPHPLNLFTKPVPTAEPKPQRFVRQAASALSQDVRTQFLEGVRALVVSSRYQEFVAIREDMSHNMHGMFHDAADVGAARFLSWHRLYLIEFEEALGSPVPYWDYENGFPAFLNEFLPLGKPARTFDPTYRLPTAAEIDSVVNIPLHAGESPGSRYQAFSSLLETGRGEPDPLPMHNQMHLWVGGIMATMSSPADPMCWLHHAAIDRIWARFQARDPDTYPDRLTGEDLILDPWEPLRLADVLDISRLGYQYA